MSRAHLERTDRPDLPRLALGQWPTPVRMLPVAGVPAGRLWVKDEGASGSVYGGNKVRKLEAILAEALARGASDVLTVGAAGSHHVLATALWARHVGLRCHAMLIPQVDSAHARDNLARIAAATGRVWTCGRAIASPAAVARAFASLALRTGRLPFYVPQGGSDPLGTLGWMSAGYEIATSVRKGEMPAPSRIYVPFGSGGTAVGLHLGLRAAGLAAEVVAVRVVGLPRGAARALALSLKVRTLALLGRAGFPRPPRLGRLTLRKGWLGPGYGATDSRVQGALARAASAGLRLEQTYTGKAFGACLEDLGADPAQTLFVSTVDAVPWTRPETRVELPPALEGLLLPAP